ncbi:MAG: hypothetical protein IJA20_00880 [Methanocorpusculum sp.]|nr:hypothetical protein [Methanocorpusculum sp.]
MTFFTPEYDIEPDYNDGVVIVDGLLHLMYWENTLAFYLLSPLDLFKDTSLGNFTTNHLYPLLMILLSSLAGVLLFSRKNPDRLSPTAAKVLAFLKEHPVSAEPAIIRGVGKSRGAVSYQLHRLLFDGKIYSAEISGKTCYSMSPILIDSPETSVYFMRNNKQQAEIISYLCSHPWATRKEIADAVSLPVDGVRYHLKNIDIGILQKGIREDAEIYAVEDWVKQLWEI